MSNILAVDIGGTNIKIGIVAKNNTIIRKKSYETSVEGILLIDRVINLIGKELKESDENIKGIAISSAGQIDSKTGLVIEAIGSSFVGYKGINVVKLLEEKFKLPVFIDNDANCAAVAEGHYGAARGYRNYITITLGTGIGGAIVVDKKLLRGYKNIAGEIGHMSIKFDGEKCLCGNFGCYELYGSTLALIKNVKNAMGDDSNISGEDIFRLLKEKDKIVLQEFDFWINCVTVGLVNLINIFNPEAIIVGGGISEQGDVLIDAIKNCLKNKTMDSFCNGLHIEKAQLNNDAALIGATRLFLDCTNNFM